MWVWIKRRTTPTPTNNWNDLWKHVKGDLSDYGFRAPKYLILILFAWKSALNPDYFSHVYFLLHHKSIFFKPEIFFRYLKNKSFDSSIERSVLITNIILFLKLDGHTGFIGKVVSCCENYSKNAIFQPNCNLSPYSLLYFFLVFYAISTCGRNLSTKASEQLKRFPREIKSDNHSFTSYDLFVLVSVDTYSSLFLSKHIYSIKKVIVHYSVIYRSFHPLDLTRNN